MIRIKEMLHCLQLDSRIMHIPQKQSTRSA